MGHVQLLDLGDPAQARDLGLHLGKLLAGHELAQPGLLVLRVRHVVVGVVARHYHQGPQDHRLVARLGYLLDHRFAGRVFRLSFHGSDEYVLVAQRFHLRLHLAVAHLRRVRRAVAHQHKRHARLLRFGKILVLRVLQRRGYYRLRYRFLVRVDGIGVLAHFAQQRLRDPHALKLVRVLLQRFRQLVVFRAVHQVRRLHYQVLYAVGYCTLQSLVHVVDELLVSGLHVVDDDLRRERSAHRPLGVRLRQRVFDALDVLRTAVVERRTEAHHQQLVFADLVGVPGIVLGGVARVTSEVIRVGLFAFHQFLLGVRQSVPRRLRRGALLIRLVCPLLYVDGVDQLRHLVGCFLVVRIHFIVGSHGGYAERKDHTDRKQNGKSLLQGLQLNHPPCFFP